MPRFKTKHGRGRTREGEFRFFGAVGSMENRDLSMFIGDEGVGTPLIDADEGGSGNGVETPFLNDGGPAEERSHLPHDEEENR